MLKKSAYALSSMLLVTSCASVPDVQLQPDPQTCLQGLPALEPKVEEDAQAPISLEMMRSFLSGSLRLRSASSLSVTPATPATRMPSAD